MLWGQKKRLRKLLGGIVHIRHFTQHLDYYAVVGGVLTIDLSYQHLAVIELQILEFLANLLIEFI